MADNTGVPELDVASPDPEKEPRRGGMECDHGTPGGCGVCRKADAEPGETGTLEARIDKSLTTWEWRVRLKGSMALRVDQIVESRDLLQDALAALREAKAVEMKYRQKLWLGHGHRGVYGDDGEMQCGECAPRFDFKRQSLEDCETAYNLAQLKRMQTPSQDGTPITALETSSGRKEGA